jgi:hypothetical protein
MNFVAGVFQNSLEKNYFFMANGGLLTKTDFDGNIIWNSSYTGDIYGLTSTSDGGYMFAGLLYSDSSIRTSNISIGKLRVNETPLPSVPELGLVPIVFAASLITTAFIMFRQLKLKKAMFYGKYCFFRYPIGASTLTGFCLQNK